MNSAWNSKRSEENWWKRRKRRKKKKNDEKWWKMMKNDEKWDLEYFSSFRQFVWFFSPLDCTTKINRFGPGETWNCSIGSQKVTFFHSKSCKIRAKSVQNSCKNVISRFSGSCACHGPHHHSLLARLHHQKQTGGQVRGSKFKILEGRHSNSFSSFFIIFHHFSSFFFFFLLFRQFSSLLLLFQAEFTKVLGGFF